MNICFIGGGNMAHALIGGLLKQDFSAAQFCVVEIDSDNRKRVQDTLGVRAVADLAAGVAGSEVIVLAVKPQQLHAAAAQMAPMLSGQLLLSIAAGIRAADLARWLHTQNVVRAMPNTPALIQSGISGLYALPAVGKAQRDMAQSILSAVGTTLWVEDETLLDAVTAVSGSGPAYVFYFIEALQQAGVELGLAADDARRLALDTFLGAAKLAVGSSDDVSVLRARVTSRNGTTERALLSMDADQVGQHIINAAKAAAARAQQMGDELGSD